MFRFWRTAMQLALALAFVQPAMTEDPTSTKGAKSLFDQGNDSAFSTHEQEETTDSAKKYGKRQTSDGNLPPGIHKQPDFPGIAYSLEVLPKGKEEVLITTVNDPRRHDFKTGDRLRMRLVSNFSGYAYVLQATSNTMSLVYPDGFGTEENRVFAGRECYVPVEGWLRLVDPAEPFTMRVLFKPESIGYPPEQPESGSLVAQIRPTEAVHREWQEKAGQKGMIFETAESYVGADTGPQTVPRIDSSSYTTHYAVVDRSQLEPASQQDQTAIAIEIPIRHGPD